MTKKDLNTITMVIRGSYTKELAIEREGNNTKLAQISLAQMARDLALHLSLNDPKFSREQFLAICEIPCDCMECGNIPF